MGAQENLNKFKIGECHNVGNCTHIGERQAIPSELANAGGFKCKYCGAPLQEPPKPRSFWEKFGKVIMLAVAVIVLAGIGLGIYNLTRGPEIDQIKLNKKSIALVIGENPTDVITAIAFDKEGTEIKDAKVTYKWTVKDNEVASVTQDGEVTAIKKGNTTVTAEIEGEANLNATCKVSVKQKEIDPKLPGASPTYIEQPTIKEPKDVTVKKTTNQMPQETKSGRYHGTLDLGYGTFSGDINNKKPDGAGVLTYRHRRVAGRDFSTGEQVYAESGERVDGTWNNGYLSSGTLFKKNGNAVKIKY